MLPAKELAMSKEKPPISPGDLKMYAEPDLAVNRGQIANSFGLFVVCWALAMWLYKAYGFWASLPLSLGAGCALVRIFILQHDCGHGSYYRTRDENTKLGLVCSLFTFTPYLKWRADHNTHHSQVGRLDGRGVGDVDTMTVAEYQALTPGKQLRYRLYRNPWVLFGIGPLALFLIGHRFSSKRYKPEERKGIHYTNLAIVAFYGLLALIFGWRALLAVELPAIWLGATAGVWLFFIQHQFPNTYWASGSDWVLYRAALEGSSYYHLPKVLQWISGNIGLHHVHHLNARIPNYNLQRCHDEIVSKQPFREVTLAESFGFAKLALWDEDRGRLIPFADLPA